MTIVEVEELPLAYLPSNALRVRVKAVGIWGVRNNEEVRVQTSSGPPLHMFALVLGSDRAACSLAHVIEHEQG